MPNPAFTSNPKALEKLHEFGAAATDPTALDKLRQFEEATANSREAVQRLHEATRNAQKALAQTRSATREAVRILRLGGATWSDIGATLGMSKQAAWEQFRDLDPTLP